MDTAHVLATDPEIGRDAYTYHGHQGRMPVVIIGGDLSDPGERRAVVAHELAHHELGHTTDHTASRFREAAMVALGAAVVAAFTASLLAGLLLAASAATAYLTGQAIHRAQELDADQVAADALDAAGMDGPGLSIAALAAAPPDPRWIRWGGWVLSGHPTLRVRMARLAR
ncbi:M48 family metalloprotease [Microtetraspora fusca]|uniref:M48 family metalloprotease n=1 Tax=Microtetraspora fusca TaxID=1997 RepID=A0ABW6VIQ7_MICFU